MTDNNDMQALPLTFAADNGTINGKINPCVSRFLEHCHRRKYPNKSVIIYAGDQPDVLYYIISGSVTVLIEDENGHEIVLAYINSGGFFGEMGLFGEHPNRSAWIAPVSNAKLPRSVIRAFAPSPGKIRTSCSNSRRNLPLACAIPAARSATSPS